MDSMKGECKEFTIETLCLKLLQKIYRVTTTKHTFVEVNNKVISIRSCTNKYNYVNVVHVSQWWIITPGFKCLSGTALLRLSTVACPSVSVTPRRKMQMRSSSLLSSARRRVDWRTSAHVRLASYFNSLRSRHVAPGRAAVRAQCDGRGGGCGGDCPCESRRGMN